MDNYYIGRSEHPYHLSVGAVVINDENKICCHYFGDASLRKGKLTKYSDFYLLMRETMEMGETIEQTLHRGLMEEFSMTGEISTFIGSVKSGWDSKDGVWIEKTTLYFLAKMKEYKQELRNVSDAEGESEIQWQTADFLIPKMQEQAKRLGNDTFDESVIVARVRQLLSQNMAI